MDKRIMTFTQVAKLFTDVWKLYREHCSKELTETELESFAAEAKKVFAQNGTAPLAKELILAVINEIDRIEQNKRREQ